MKKIILACGLAIILVGGSTAVLAQYSGSSAAAIATSQTGQYTGPTSVPLMTSKQLLSNSSDKQNVRMIGRIVSHDGGKNYTFADESGRLPVEISPKHFPSGQPVSAEQRVELIGEIDKDFFKMKFEVDQIRLMP